MSHPSKVFATSSGTAGTPVTAGGLSDRTCTAGAYQSRAYQIRAYKIIEMRRRLPSRLFTVSSGEPELGAARQ